MEGIIDNLTSALNTWNEKLAEIWMLLTQSPESFKGGDIWNIIVKIHGALQAIGLSLLVLEPVPIGRISNDQNLPSSCFLDSLLQEVLSCMVWN